MYEAGKLSQDKHMDEIGTGKQQDISRNKESDLQRKQDSKSSLSPCSLTADTNSAAVLSLFNFRMIYSLHFGHDSYRNLTMKPTEEPGSQHPDSLRCQVG